MHTLDPVSGKVLVTPIKAGDFIMPDHFQTPPHVAVDPQRGDQSGEY